MPLYEHAATGERKRTVPGKYEDRRVAASGEWTLVAPPSAPADEEQPPPVAVPAPSRRGARTTD